MPHHDLIVIGTGSGNAVIADDPADQPYWPHPALTDVVEIALLDAGERRAA